MAIPIHDPQTTGFPYTTRVFGNDPPPSQCPEPIAIVGMACRWPGGATSPSKLWDLLEQKRSGYTDFEENKLSIRGFYHPNQHRPGSMFTKGGYFLKEDPKQFDHTFFGITPLETMTMDPAQRKLLEVTYEAFENAGESWDSFSASYTGVFVGNFNYDHQLMQVRDADHPLPYVITGGGITILSNRINYVFNLHGPSMTLDTACSSSMYALHLAVSSIRSGECNSAIVGGSNLILGPEAQLFSTKLGAISPTSTCHTFDAAADGYARADGFGVLYIKKLSEAIANKDPIRAVIRATAINANGRTGGISHPSPEGQEAVMRRAYEAAGGLDPNLTGYFECHGTGTAVGDPLEVSAVGRLFATGRQEEPLLIGSIKPNLGHSESSSGLAGVMKAVLAIEHGQIPATIGLVNPNPNIDFDGARVKVVTETTPWPVSKPIRRASVNSFGYGGANAHCILEGIDSFVPGYKPYASRSASNYSSEASIPQHIAHETVTDTVELTDCHAEICKGYHRDGDKDLDVYGPSDGYVGATLKMGNNPIETQTLESEIDRELSTQDISIRRLVLLPFSGHDEYSLKANISAIVEVADEYHIADLAYTLSVRRSKFLQRAFAITTAGSSAASLEESTMTFAKCSASPQSVGYIFTGQGAQWPRMGAELLEEFEQCRRCIRSMDAILSKLPEPPDWTIESALLEPSETSRIKEPEFSQPLCTALQIAIVDLLSSWNVKPVATVGHSSGEIAAAYAAGVHTAEEAIVMAYYRGQVLASHTIQGRMLAVGLGPDGVLPYIKEVETKVVIAAINSPSSVTLSGDEEFVLKVKQALDQDKVFARLLQTGGKAYHSHHMAILGETYESLAQNAVHTLSSEIAGGRRQDTATWVSSVVPSQTQTSQSIGPAYWRKNLESPVLFGPAVERVANLPEINLDIWVEIGPHAALAGPLRQIRATIEQRHGVKLPTYLPSITRAEDGFKNMLSLAGNLFIRNVPVNLGKVNVVEIVDDKAVPHTASGMIIGDLPNYQFHYGTPLYHESRYNKEWRLRKHLRHDILGARQPGCAKERPSWRNMLRMKDVPWLDDHKLIPEAVFPAASYLAMAIEAMSQQHREAENAPQLKGFLFRNVVINSTLKVPDDELGVETILTLQSASLINSKASKRWYEFKISSVQNDQWTEHCQGTISGEIQHQTHDTDFYVDSRSRPIESISWYKKFADVGLGYGPAFQGLSHIRGRPDRNRATAAISLHTTRGMVAGGESNYAIHPATIDTCFQLALLACHAGQVDNVRKAFVPIVVEEMSLWIPGEEDAESEIGYGQATGELRGLRGAYAQTQLYGRSGEILIDVKQLRCVSYDGTSLNAAEATFTARNPYLRLVWKPHFDSLTNDQAKALFPPTRNSKSLEPTFEDFDKLTAYILVQIYSAHSDLFEQLQSEHLQRFLDWVQRCVAKARLGQLPYGQEATGSSFTERKCVIERLSEKLGEIVEAKLIKRIFDQLPEIFAGETSGLQVALKDDLLAELYISGIGISGGYPQLTRVVDLLVHQQPCMTILEIGAGTGGATRLLMDTLKGRSQFKRYEKYCFTDISTSFLTAAQDEFSRCASIEYMTLDIQKDPLEQGFEADYDMIVASQVLHATTRISETVQHARSLLKTGGKMVLLEITNARLGTGLVLGTFPDYWNGVADGRVDSPLLTKAMWQAILLQNGFSGIDVLLDDHEDSVAMASVIVTTAVKPSIPGAIRSASGAMIYLVHGNLQPSFSYAIESVAVERGYDIRHISILEADAIKRDSRIIVVADLLENFLESIDEVGLECIKLLFRKVSSLVWVTAGGLINGAKPESAVIGGLMRAIITEMPHVHFLTIDLEVEYDVTDEDIAMMILIKEEALQKAGEKREAVDSEYFFKDGLLHISRLIPDETLNQRYTEQEGYAAAHFVSLETQKPLAISFDQPGLLSSLYFKEDKSFRSPLRPDEIEMETRAIGLNVKDLAVALGRFDWNKHSTESSGVVTKVGSQVENIAVGDAVFGATPGNFGNYVRVLGASVQKMKPTHSFEDVASMPVAFMTAIYALNRIARLSKDETVLIQSATGGLGMAAMQLAKHIGAEIYATVGNSKKAEVLMNEFGIAEDHIFKSREIRTPSKILAATESNGIDVILSSAAGENMHESWRIIAPMGRFIEVGRTDVLDHGKLSLEVFKRNATFSSFDLGLMNQQKPEYVAGLMAELGDLYRQGVIKPLNHIKTFDISRLEQAMMQFAKGTHLGKVVVTFQDPRSMLKVRPSLKQVCLDANATYLLVGCLGGLGRSISTWMAEHGARNLLYLSRSGSSNPEAVALLEDLRTMGVTTRVAKCDIANRESLFATVSQAELPIKGVIQAAMVVGDSIFDNVTLEQYKSVTDPKVKGTINLHLATLNQPLEFFTMTSSIVTMIGTATQGSYCAGNAFQDAFARFRASLNLPSQAFALGMILEVGFVSDLPEVQKSLMRNGVYGTGQMEFLKVFEASFFSQQQQQQQQQMKIDYGSNDWYTYDPLATSHLLTGLEPIKLDQLYRQDLAAEFTWHTDARFSRLLQALRDLNKKVKNSRSDSTSVAELLKNASPSKFRQAVTAAIVDRLAKLLFTPSDEIDPSRAVSDYGMDSMIAAELRNWFVKSFQTDVTFLDLLNPQTKILGLVEKVFIEHTKFEGDS